QIAGEWSSPGSPLPVRKWLGWNARSPLPLPPSNARDGRRGLSAGSWSFRPVVEWLWLPCCQCYHCWRRMQATISLADNHANDQRLSISDRFQFSKERRIRYTCRVGPENRRLTFRAQRGHGERHSDAVIAERIEFRAVHMLAARNPHSIGPLFDFRPHFSQIGSDGRNAVRLFHAQFPGIANFEAAVRVRRNRRQHRD